MLTSDEVAKIAKLAHLSVSTEEISEFTKQLSSILEYVNQLKAIDVSGIEPMSHVHGSTNVMRDDVTKPSMSVESLLKLVPDHSGRFIRVPIIIE